MVVLRAPHSYAVTATATGSQQLATGMIEQMPAILIFMLWRTAPHTVYSQQHAPTGNVAVATDAGLCRQYHNNYAEPSSGQAQPQAAGVELVRQPGITCIVCLPQVVLMHAVLRGFATCAASGGLQAVARPCCTYLPRSTRLDRQPYHLHNGVIGRLLQGTFIKHNTRCTQTGPNVLGM